MEAGPWRDPQVRQPAPGAPARLSHAPPRRSAIIGPVSPDPWSAFLAWLSTILIPDWSALIALLPLFVLIGVTGPLVSLLAAVWVWHRLRRRAGRVKTAVPDVVSAPLDAEGRPVFPPNVPYNPARGLIYPPERTTCELDGSNLLVRCPVDGTVREAAIQVCSACGTRFILGAGSLPTLVTRSNRPPTGGAAVA